MKLTLQKRTAHIYAAPPLLFFNRPKPTPSFVFLYVNRVYLNARKNMIFKSCQISYIFIFDTFQNKFIFY